MLRIYGSAVVPAIDVTIRDGYDPPRIPLTPRQRRLTLAQAVGLSTEAVYDAGIEATTPVRFVSSETQGFLLASQVDDLKTLYEAGGNFLIDTDLLLPLGEAARTYNAIWTPGPPPRFEPVAQGALYFLDLPVRIKEAI